MSEATLMNLRDYLYGALSPANLIWLGTQLTEHGLMQEEPLKPYTKDELLARIERSEQQYAEGKYKTSEELWRELDEEFHSLDKEAARGMDDYGRPVLLLRGTEPHLFRQRLAQTLN